MGWLKDAVWQQGVAIVLVVLGSILIHLDAAATGELGGGGWLGFALFAAGVALPLVGELHRSRREHTAGVEDV
ncbi:MAG TPA: hypothetical protein PLH21_10630 [Chiayiivirga sp.]|nr:hypothetical protein [Chiayiivirga sp.]